MPFYEDKLISPLAIRFTQQRIREKFQDGHEVEATIKEIKAGPGVGDYDIILQAPFPTIEIIRYSPNGRRAGGQSHWFSYDNRRLYCLQRVAAEYWPKRVGAVVEVLYCDAGNGIRKKLDTQTGGLCVSIGHAFAVGDELQEWSWREAVQRRRVSRNLVHAVEAALAADDAKATVHDLTDAPAAPSAFERLMSSEADALEPEIPLPVTNAKVTQTAPDLDPEVPTTSLCTAVDEHQEEPSKSDEEHQEADTISTGQLLPTDEDEEEVKGAHGTVLPTDEQQEEPKPSFHEEQEDADVSTEKTLASSDHSLAGLIGQLLAAEPNNESAIQADEAPAEQSLTSIQADEAPEEQSLTSLIGQFLVLKTNEPLQTSEPTSDATSSTCLPDRSESVDSTSVVSLSGDEDKGRASVAKDHSSPESKQSTPEQKRKKEPRDAKAAQQAQAARAVRAAHLQRARCQMAHWQMAQWQAAQMAQWQHASFAAAQFQAAQAAQWQQGYH